MRFIVASTLTLTLTLTLFGARAYGEDCKKALEPAREHVEAQKTGERLKTVLREISGACPDTLGPLARAAKEAIASDRKTRAELLARAGSLELAQKKSVEDPLAQATAIAGEIALPESLRVSKEALARIDAGSYLFAAALHKRLDAAGAFDSNAEAILRSFLLAAALEGEAAAKKK